MEELLSLFSNVLNLDIKQIIMWIIGGILIYLAIKKKMEPTLLLPIGFGTILVNLPMSGAINQMVGDILQEGPISILFESGIANELFPLLLFVGIGAMIDFGPLLSNPKLMVFGAAAQFGIFFTLSLASLFGFELKDAASIAIIGAADGPTSIFVANYFGTKYIGAIIVAAYSYMALVPIVQPPIIKLLTTKKERKIRMDYTSGNVSKTAKIIFPIFVTILTGLVAPNAVALIGFLMFGNLIRECGVLDSLSETAQHDLANLITLFLGITIAEKMQADAFLNPQTLLILGLGLVAFIFDTAGGVLFAKLINIFAKKKINPMIGAAGISAFPMSARVVHKLGLEEDSSNFLLAHTIGINVSGQIASVIAGGLILNLIAR
ncbi:MAG: sodium ion-translocating decarboxylase subunit beta [Eubacterium sp.]|nr:sodium ion-translocating decarboxylase subunit beta [Eubacterium sp.]